VLLPAVCLADPWLPPGDVLMRHDLQVLADAGLVRGPITSWPIPWPDVARDVLDVDAGKLTPAQHQSLLRVQRGARSAMRSYELQRDARIGGTSHPETLRGFAAALREDAEVSAGISWMGDRSAVRLRATAVGDAEDGKTLRPDDSYLGVSFANFMLSAGYMQRWWGPGWDGSLILSTNARPVPAITLERNYSDPFDLPVLRWLGPWRAAIVFGQLEDERPDFDETRFFAARVTLRPWRHLEVGLSRSAQWCGEGRVCGFDTFQDLLLGRDNRGDDLDLEEEPGNQLAGYDVRLSSPWSQLPLAIYGQLIGEDEAGGLPSKFLGLAGLELAGSIARGAFRVRVEYSDTTCSFSRARPQLDCAYESGIYTAGYRFRGQSIGHSTDGDSRQTSFGALYATDSGATWEVRLRDAELNRDADAPESVHTQAALATDLQAIDIVHATDLMGGRLALGAGLERRELAANGSGDDEWRVTAQWSRAL